MNKTSHEDVLVQFINNIKSYAMKHIASFTTRSEVQLPEILDNRPIIQLEEASTKEEERMERMRSLS